MNDETNSGKPAKVPYKWADAHIKAMQGGNGLGGEKEAESQKDGLVAGNGGQDKPKADGKYQEGETENFINEHVVARVFIAPSGARFPVYDGGRYYHGREDSLHRAIHSRTNKGD